MPPRITFLEPDLSGPTIPMSDVVTLRWTPTQETGTVEATAAAAWSPDAQTSFTIVRCSASVAAGELAVPLPPVTGVNPGDSIGGLSVRVVNTVRVQRPGLTVDVKLASFDSGRLDEALP